MQEENYQKSKKQQPRLGDASSLWNFTPSPGWNESESMILKMLLMQIGVGRWVQILETGLLPGKLIQQLNGQTQRLLGAQSTAAYSGLKVNVDKIREDNLNRKDVERKAGLIINDLGKLSKEERARLMKENQEKYVLNSDEKEQIDQFLQKEYNQMEVHKSDAKDHDQAICRVPIFELLGANPKLMGRSHKIYVLKALYLKLEQIMQNYEELKREQGLVEQCEEDDEEQVDEQNVQLQGNLPSGKTSNLQQQNGNCINNNQSPRSQQAFKLNTSHLNKATDPNDSCNNSDSTNKLSILQNLQEQNLNSQEMYDQVHELLISDTSKIQSSQDQSKNNSIKTHSSREWGIKTSQNQNSMDFDPNNVEVLDDDSICNREDLSTFQGINKGQRTLKGGLKQNVNDNQQIKRKRAVEV